MSIISEGTLTIAVAEGYNVLTTSGALAYRKSDNKLFYFYYNKRHWPVMLPWEAFAAARS